MQDSSGEEYAPGPGTARHAWTQDEDKKLRAAKTSGASWDSISRNTFGGIRSSAALETRWRKVLKGQASPTATLSCKPMVKATNIVRKSTTKRETFPTRAGGEARYPRWSEDEDIALINALATSATQERDWDMMRRTLFNNQRTTGAMKFRASILGLLSGPFNRQSNDEKDGHVSSDAESETSTGAGTFFEDEPYVPVPSSSKSQGSVYLADAAAPSPVASSSSPSTPTGFNSSTLAQALHLLDVLAQELKERKAQKTRDVTAALSSAYLIPGATLDQLQQFTVKLTAELARLQEEEQKAKEDVVAMISKRLDMWLLEE